MKKVLGTLLLLTFASFGYVIGYKEIQRVVYKKQLLPNLNFVKKVEPEAVREEKPFVVTIPSYRNEKFCERNLRSVFEQNYTNYRIIYVDDASPDNTYERVKEIVTEFGQWHRFTLLKNEINRGAMYNHVQMSQLYQNDEIVVMLDGDDFFASDQVLQELNRCYANPNVWVTYGQYIVYPEYKVGHCKPMSFATLKKGDIRERPWVTSALRTFYGGLFRRIRMEDFLFGSVFLPMSCDPAYMFPIVEMAREHVYFTQDIGYIYNRNTGIHDDLKSRGKQIFFEAVCREKTPYPFLKEHPGAPLPAPKVKNADVLVFSTDRPVELFATLDSLTPLRGELGEIFIFADPQEVKLKAAYERIAEEFPYIRLSFKPEFKESLLHVLNRPASDHIWILSEGMILEEGLHLRECTQDLEAANLFAYTLQKSKSLAPHYQHVLPLRGIREDLHAMAFSSTDRMEWEKDPLAYATLYRKNTLKEWLEPLKTLTLDTFWHTWPFRNEGQSVLVACKDEPLVTHIYQLTGLPQEFFAKESLDRFIRGESYADCLYTAQVIADAS